MKHLDITRFAHIDALELLLHSVLVIAMLIAAIIVCFTHLDFFLEFQLSFGVVLLVLVLALVAASHLVYSVIIKTNERKKRVIRELSPRVFVSIFFALPTILLVLPLFMRLSDPELSFFTGWLLAPFWFALLIYYVVKGGVLIAYCLGRSKQFVVTQQVRGIEVGVAVGLVFSVTAITFFLHGAVWMVLAAIYTSIPVAVSVVRQYLQSSPVT